MVSHKYQKVKELHWPTTDIQDRRAAMRLKSPTFDFFVVTFYMPEAPSMASEQQQWRSTALAVIRILLIQVPMKYTPIFGLGLNDAFGNDLREDYGECISGPASSGHSGDPAALSYLKNRQPATHICRMDPRAGIATLHA